MQQALKLRYNKASEIQNVVCAGDHEFPRKGGIGSFPPQFLLVSVKIGQIPGKVPEQNTKTEVLPD